MAQETIHQEFERYVDSGNCTTAYRFLMTHKDELAVSRYVPDGLSKLYIRLCREGTYDSVVGMEAIFKEASSRP